MISILRHVSGGVELGLGLPDFRGVFMVIGSHSIEPWGVSNTSFCQAIVYWDSKPLLYLQGNVILICYLSFAHHNDIELDSS